MKKTLTLILALMLCVSLAAPALAEETSGKCGENVTWSYSDGTLTIEGTGDMYDYSNIKRPWRDLPAFDEMKTLVIGDGVTSIGAHAFAQTYLENVIIGNSVTSLGEGAFAYGMYLKSVTIPVSVIRIGSATFSGCSWITDIYYGGNESQWKQVEIDIGNYDLDNAAIHYSSAAPSTDSGKCGENATWSYSGGTLTIEGTGKLDDYALEDAGSGPDRTSPPWEASIESVWDIVNVVIKDGVTELGALTFRYYGITSATLPASLTRIGEGAFSDCPGLTDVYYGGDAGQWNQMIIGNDNASLLNATVHFSDGTSTAGSPMADGESTASVTVNGVAVQWTDVKPFIDGNDRTMVPLRAVADAMGLDVNWDESEREAIFAGESKMIAFPIGSTTARGSEGDPVQMDTAAVIVNDRTYAPIRYLAEFFGYTVGWDGATRTVTITG